MIAHFGLCGFNNRFKEPTPKSGGRLIINK